MSKFVTAFAKINTFSMRIDVLQYCKNNLFTN